MSLLVMDIVLALRPKNMTIRELARSNTGEKLTTYIFNSTEYTHVGSWPPVHVPGFHVPIASAKVLETDEDITAQVRRFAGPRHVVDIKTLRYALGTWSWTLGTSLTSRLSLKTVPYLMVPDAVPKIVVTDVLGQISIF